MNLSLTKHLHCVVLQATRHFIGGADHNKSEPTNRYTSPCY
jgi:hypothetical protein